MSAESIVVSLEWARRLKALGFDDRTIWCWVRPVSSGMPELFNFITAVEMEERGSVVFGAPTADEILRSLPREIGSSMDEEFVPTIQTVLKGWGIGYYVTTDGVWMEDAYFIEDTLANAAAAMYCYLVEQKLLPKAA